MSFTERATRRFLAIKAARSIRPEIEKAGLDNLKILAETGRSIMGAYLDGCSPPEKAKLRRDLGALLQTGVTADMILEELSRQIPELALIMKSKEEYKSGELARITSFVKEA